MRVLVTGAGGLVGAAVAERLAAGGCEVVALVHERPAPEAAASAVRADLAAPGALESATAGEEPCAAVVHAAAAIGMRPDDPAVTAVNCAGTQAVLALAERWRCESFVFCSSVQVAGRPRELPVTEDHPPDPPTAYHASKLFGERLVELARRRGLAAATLRLSSPLGPGLPDGRIAATFVRRAVAGEPLEVAGAGTRRQDYVDVRDVAEGVARALDARATGTFNLAAGRSVSNLELAERCVTALGSGSEIRTGGRPDPEEGFAWEISIARAAEAFGYAPARSLEDSLRGVASAMSRSPRRAELRK